MSTNDTQALALALRALGAQIQWMEKGTLMDRVPMLTLIDMKVIADALASRQDQQGQAWQAKLRETRGYHALVQVIYELQQDGQYSDEEGEETAALADLVIAIEKGGA